jgi:hypothetical protein
VTCRCVDGAWDPWGALDGDLSEADIEQQVAAFERVRAEVEGECLRENPELSEPRDRLADRGEAGGTR